MMEFLLYLSPDGQFIYNMVSKKVRVVENAPICRQHDIFGFYSATKKTLTFCTDKIKTYGNIEYNVFETLLHESAHVAQSCKGNFQELIPFGINSSSMYLNSRRENDLKKVIAYDRNLKQIDREAFWMEDKPSQVKYVLQKYCF
jgi:hypothetical protein